MLRKIFAILLLSIHFFVTGGYQLVLSYFEHKADNSLVQKLDNNQYNEAELITLKIPLNMPYTGDKADFERCDGTININGVFYNYVQRKLINDTLILQCIANNEKNKLSEAKNEYAKIAGNAQPVSGSEKTAISLLKFFFFEYSCKTGYDMQACSALVTYAYMPANNNTLPSPSITPPAKPPEIIMA